MSQMYVGLLWEIRCELVVCRPGLPYGIRYESFVGRPTVGNQMWVSCL